MDDLTELPDPEAPELFPTTYPREGFPRYEWTARPEALPAAAWTTETTHRDGQQGGLPLDADAGIRIYDLMCAFTGASGALRQAEFFVYRSTDRRILEAALERHAGGAPVEPTTWIRASRRDAELVGDLGVRETGMLASASDYHTFHKFRPGGRRQAAAAYLDAVHAVLDAGLRPRLHLEDATRAPEEFVLPFVEAVREACASFGADVSPKVPGVRHDGPRAPARRRRRPALDPAVDPPAARARGRERGPRVPSPQRHPPRDGQLPRGPHGRLRGDQRHAPRHGRAHRQRSARGRAPARDRDGRRVRAAAGLPRPQRARRPLRRARAPARATYPLYGRDAHRTRAGIHADGLNKFWWMYAPFDVQRLIGRPLEVSLTRDSGVAGLVFLIRRHTGRELAKDDPELLRLHAELMAQFDAGRQTAVEWEEVADLMDRPGAAASRGTPSRST